MPPLHNASAAIAVDTAAIDSGYCSNTPCTVKPSPDNDGTSTPAASAIDAPAGLDFDADFPPEDGADDEDYEELPSTKRKTARSITDDLPKAPAKRRFLAGLRLPTLVSPKSAYEGWAYPDLPVSKERIVLREFEHNAELEEQAAQIEASGNTDTVPVVIDDDKDAPRLRGTKRKQRVEVVEQDAFTSYKLDDFSIYYPAFDKRFPMEMTCLHNLSVKVGKNALLFDGVLNDGKTRRYVEGVPFAKLSIGNYGELGLHTVEGAIWIQSDAAKGAGDAWYELGKPAQVYEKYHKPFLWLANFAKFFIDFLDRPKRNGDEGDERPEDVTLRDFESHFGTWIRQLHGTDARFQTWLAEYGADKLDFRQVVAVHCQFLWNQAYNTDTDGRLVKHSLWDEVMRLTTIKPVKGALVDDTIVTPLVYDCFHHIFGDKLKAITPRVPQPPGQKLVMEKVEIRSPPRAQEQTPTGAPVSREVSVPRLQDGQPVNVQQGDVVAVIKDVDTVWKGKSEYWYAYVQSVNKPSQKRITTTNSNTTLDVIWLYLPEDTILGQMRYPYANELFFSDNCNCGDAKLRLDEVLFKANVAFFAGPDDAPGYDFFLRQKFSDAESNFTTLTKSDLTCECRKPVVSAFEQVKKQYEIGDTVLVESYSVDDMLKDVLEPAQIVRYDEESQSVELRHLYRRARDFTDKPDARPNELVYTDFLALVQPKFIHRRCHVRFLPMGSKPPAPYDRDGTGDCFFIYQRRNPAGDLVPADTPPDFHEGYDPDTPPGGDTPPPRLAGMDLFCGGGNFGRGIEEGGAVINKWAVDLDVPALHTYRANLREPDTTQLYLGSVNNYLRDGLLGKFSALIPPPGQVDFISAGSPCQGFSNANNDRDSERSLGNSSLVASVASFVDFYRPRFALLENVHGLAQDRIKKKDGLPYNVFSQLLCSLVAIGSLPPL